MYCCRLVEILSSIYQQMSASHCGINNGISCFIGATEVLHVQQTWLHQRSFINRSHQPADECPPGLEICCLSYGACRVYSPSPAVSREESTFNLEVAIRGGLFRVNTTDKRDKTDRPQSMRTGSRVIHTMWSLSLNCLACSLLLPGHKTVADLTSHSPCLNLSTLRTK